MITITRQIKALKPDFLERANRSGYVCPVCGNGTGRDGDGLKPHGDNYNYHCFRCGFSGDVIDLFGAAYGIEDPGEKIRAFAGHYGLKDDSARKGEWPAVKRTQNSVPKEQEPEREKPEPVDRSGYLHACTLNNDGSYLASRGIPLASQRRFGIGFDPAWRNPKAIETLKAKGRSPESIPCMPALIIPRSGGSYLARDVRPETDIPEDRRKYMKQAVGPITLFNGQALMSPGPVFVTEGEIDAMSVAEAGGEAAAICSAVNQRLLLEWLIEHPGRCPSLILMLDNDGPGRDAAGRLMDELCSIGVASTVADYSDAYKDPNEYWCADPAGMRATVLKNIMSARYAAAAAGNNIV